MNKTFNFFLIRSICCYSASLKDQARLGLRKNQVKKSYQNHDHIDGFEWTYGTDYGITNKTVKNSDFVGVNSTGYFYSDIDIYTTPFTNCSKLMLLKMSTHYFAGSYLQNTLNGEYRYIDEKGSIESFDKHFDLNKGKIEIVAGQYVNPMVDASRIHRHSSSIVQKQHWPLSSPSPSSVTTSFGTSLELKSEVSGGVNIADGVFVSATRGGTLTFSYSKSATITNDEPKITSSQPKPDAGIAVYDYSYEGYGKTLDFVNYVLYEVKNDTNIISDPYYVNLDISWERNNVAWKKAPWERRYPVAKKTNLRFVIR